MTIRILLVCVALAGVSWPQEPAKQNAEDLLLMAITAMGGEQKLRDLNTMHLKMIGHRNLLEESERPEGPYIVDYQQTDEWRDLEHGNWRQEVHRRNVLEEDATTIIVADGAAAQKAERDEVPASPEQLQLANDALTKSPERVLLNGLASRDLKRLPDLIMQGVPHHLVQFTHDRTALRIYLNSETHLPTAVEWTVAYPYGLFWSVWGDVTTRVYYSLWWLQDGIHYPLQMDTIRNGLPDRSDVITKGEFNPTPPGDAFTISAASAQAFAARARVTADDRPLGSAARPVQEPAPGIVIIPGPWNTTLIHQSDGIVVLEAPISSGYSGRVLLESERRFPGVPVKAVITTSDAWPHIGGVREYVARGIPVYVLDRTVPLIQRLIAAPHTQYPDSLAKSPRRPVFREVKTKTIIGMGPNRIEIFPLHGETSERQLMVYFPEHKLLYGSDAFQQLPDGKYFIPQTVSEVADAVAREHLAVDQFYMMHMRLTPWNDAQNVVHNAQ